MKSGSIIIIFLILTSCQLPDNVEGKYKNQFGGLISEITFQKEYCHFKYIIIGDIGGKFKKDNDHIYIETSGEIGTLTLKVINSYTLEGLGWAAGIYVKEGYEEEYKKSLLGIYVVKSAKLNVRTGPGTNYQVLGQFKNNERVQVIEITSDNWLKVKTTLGDGYVYREYMSKE